MGARLAVGTTLMAAVLVLTGAGAVDSLALSVEGQSPAIVAFRIRNGGIEEPLSERPGDAARGRRIALDPDRGNCLICHTVPDADDEPFQGNLGPPLAGVGRRLGAAQLRLRIVDGTRINPQTPMPAFYRVDGLNRVASQWRGKPVLSASEVEDVVAYLQSI